MKKQQHSSVVTTEDLKPLKGRRKQFLTSTLLPQDVCFQQNS